MAKSKVSWELPAFDPPTEFSATRRAYVDARAVPAGGTAGQVLTKQSANDRDAIWANPTGGGGGGGSSTIRGTLDYDDSTAPTDGQSIVWSGTSGKFRPLTLTAGMVGADPSGTAAAQRTSHEQASDPHTQYLTNSRGDGRYSALGHVHSASDITSGTLAIARIPTGTTGTTVALGNDSRFTDARTPTAHASTHASGGSDAVTPAAIGAAAASHAHSGADITSGTVAYARLPVGTAASTVAAGDDARLSNARTPTAHVHATGDVTSGTFDIARIPLGTTSSTVTVGNDARLSDARTPLSHVHSGADITTGTVGYARLPVGTAASTVAAGDDARLSNARTPTAHASSHASNGSDPITPSSIGASATGHAHAAGDVTSGTFDIARIPTGTTGTTVALGNDGRFTDSRTPTAHAASHGAGASDDLSALYVNLGGAQNVTGVKTVPAGTGNSWIFNQPPQVAVGTAANHPVRRDDARLTDSRTPTTHASTHAIGGSDVLTPQAIGAAAGTTPTSIKTTAYTAVVGDFVLVDASSGPLTVTAPTITANGQRFGVKKVDTSANVVTIAAASGNTIGSLGAASIPIRDPDQAGTYQANGTNWVIPHGYHSLTSLTARFAAAAAGVPTGGSTGQILTKTGAADYSMAWAAAPSTGVGGWVDCSAMTTAAQINTASSTAGDGATIWLGRRPSSSPLVLEDTIIMRPRQRILGAGGRAQLTCLQAGASFTAGKPLIAAQGYLNNQSSADSPVSVVGVHLDANQKTGSHGLVVYNFWSHFEDIQVANCSGAAAHGIHATDNSANNTKSQNSHSENTFVRCRFMEFFAKATFFWAECTNGLNNSNQDGHLKDCFFAGNYQGGHAVRVTRAAGWTFDNNHLYGIGWDGFCLDAVYATKVTNNYIEDFGGENLANPGDPTYGYYQGINLSTVLNTRASVVSGNTVSVLQPDPVNAQRFTCFYARAGSGQSLANVVFTGNTAVWASSSAPTTNRAHAFRFGEGGDTGRMLYVEWAGNQIQTAIPWQVTRYVASSTVTLTEPGAGGAGVPTTRLISSGAGLSGGGDLSADRTLSVVYGTAANTAVQGNDTRVTADQAVGTASIRTLGTGALQAAAGNDSRFTDARTPTTHASTHRAGGSDQLLAIIGALSANTTLTDAQEVVVVDSSGGARTITLPTASGRAGRRFIIKKLGGTTANPVTIASNGGTIDGISTEVIAISGGFRELMSDGTNWHIVGGRLDPVVVGPTAIAASGTISIDATIGSVYRFTTAGSATLAVPTNPFDADTINIEIAPSAAGTLTINGSILLTTGLSSSISLTSGKRTFLALRFVSGVGWYLLAASSTL